MKIALLTDGIQPYVIGGMQKHSFYLAKFFASRGVTVDLYHFSQEKDTDIEALSVFSEPEKKYINSIVLEFPEQGSRPGHYLRASYQYSERIFEVLQNRLADVDFIYAKGFTAWKLLKEKKKGMKLPPVGVKFHGMNMFQQAPSIRGWLQQFMMRPPVKFNMAAADYVFSYGGKITDITIKAGVAREKVIEIPTGIDRSWLVDTVTPEHKFRQLIYVGRYERLKGVEELNQALETLTKSYEVVFHFVGDIPEEKKLKHERIQYHGKIIDAEKIKAIYRQCDVLVLPSYSEGMPNVILEAMASGLAVIATDVGAVNTAVSIDTGWLIEPANVGRLKSGIVKALLMESDKLQLKKENALQFVKEHLLWEHIIDQTIEKISQAVELNKY